MYWRVLAGRERVLGPGHPYTLRCIVKLVAVLYDQGKFSGAETMYRRAVTEGEQALGPRYRTALKNANCLAMFLRARGSSSTGESSLPR